MRITGGTWCGRRIKTPPGDQIRPTQDWVREALFSILAESVAETHWIDLFGGSGAVGLDALSRGAGGVTWIEKNVQNARLIYENFLELAGPSVQATQPDPGRGVLHTKKIHPRQIPSIPLPDRYPDTELVIADATAWLAQGGKGRNAKVLYADPPYEDARNNGFAAIEAKRGRTDQQTARAFPHADAKNGAHCRLGHGELRLEYRPVSGTLWKNECNQFVRRVKDIIWMASFFRHVEFKEGSSLSFA